MAKSVQVTDEDWAAIRAFVSGRSVKGAVAQVRSRPPVGQPRVIKKPKTKSKVAKADSMKAAQLRPRLATLEMKLASARSLVGRVGYDAAATDLVDAVDREHRRAKTDLLKAATTADARALNAHLAGIQRVLGQVEKLPVLGAPSRLARFTGVAHNRKVSGLRVELADLEKRADETNDRVLARGYRELAEDVEKKLKKLGAE